MNLPLFISHRYLFARKSHSVINIISAISAVGMAVGTAALVLILSVYNGFDRIIKDNISDLDPDILVAPATGKCFVPKGPAFDALLDDSCAASISSVVSENVFLKYGTRQCVARAKGVDAVFEEESAMGKHILAGEFTLHREEVPLASAGAGLASQMGMHPRFLNRMELWFPDRNAGISMANPAASLRSVEIRPGSIFSVNSDLDASLLILPIETMRELLGYGEEVTGVEIRLADGVKAGRFARKLGKDLGEDFMVLDRYHQNPTLYKMMRYEKSAIFLILLFVVIIIAFNIFGSLSMLIMEKKEDIGTLRAMGAGDRTIRRVFVLEGWMISLLGLAAGLLIGTALAAAQQHFGIVRMPGNFLVDAYPVCLSARDIIATAASVAATGYLIARLSTRHNNI